VEVTDLPFEFVGGWRRQIALCWPTAIASGGDPGVLEDLFPDVVSLRL